MLTVRWSIEASTHLTLMIPLIFAIQCTVLNNVYLCRQLSWCTEIIHGQGFFPSAQIDKTFLASLTLWFRLVWLDIRTTNLSSKGCKKFSGFSMRHSCGPGGFEGCEASWQNEMSNETSFFSMLRESQCAIFSCMLLQSSLLRYRFFSLWRSAKQFQHLYLNQGGLYDHLYMALNLDIPLLCLQFVLWTCYQISTSSSALALLHSF